MRQLRVAREQLTQVLGKTPSNKEIAIFTGLAPAEVERRLQETVRGFVASLDQAKGTLEDSEETLSDSLVDNTVCVEELASIPSRRALIKEALLALSARERMVLWQYYFEERNLRQIGEMLGVSEARISQIHSRCLKRIRDFLGQEMLGLVA